MRRARSILLLGSRSGFTAMVLSELARSRAATLRAAVLGQAPRASPAAGSVSHPLAVDVPDPLAQAAAEYDVHVEALGEPADITRRGERPDLIVTACFPARLSQVLLAYPRAGGLNVHPSLLPAYRGPSPLFWQLRAGEPAGGVTIHKLSERLDAGDVVAAQSRAIPAGVTVAELNRELVDAGGRLLVAALGAHDWENLPGTPQDESRSSHHTWPVQADFRMDVRWPAERAYRFMRGTADWGQPYVVEVDGAQLMLERALGFDDSEEAPGAWVREGEVVRVAFETGVLRALARG